MSIPLPDLCTFCNAIITCGNPDTCCQHHAITGVDDNDDMIEDVSLISLNWEDYLEDEDEAYNPAPYQDFYPDAEDEYYQGERYY